MSTSLSKEELDIIKEAFEVFDADKSGSIDASELAGVLRAMGESPSDEEISMMLRQVDKDGNGTIELDEFIKLMEDQRMNIDEDEEIRQSFEMFDADGNGFISATELLNAMKMLGNELTEEEVAEMIQEADLDGDGEVSFEEFKLMLHSVAE